EHDCLHIRGDSDPFRGWILWDEKDSSNKIQAEVDPILVANHTDTLLRASFDGCGIASMATNLVEPLLMSGGMVRVLAPWITGNIGISASWPSRQFIPKRVQVYLEYLVETNRKKN